MVGLNDEEVLTSRKLNGRNVLSKNKRKSFFRLIIEACSDPIIKILLIVLVIKVAFLFQDENWFETIGILVAVIVSALISAISEYGSDKEFNHLEDELDSNKVLVIRNKLIKEICSKDIVVGDLVILSSGNKIYCDGHIIKGSLVVNESSINGESKEISKSINDVVYSGTSIYDGDATIICDKVGDNTLIGELAKEIQEEAPVSPLKLRLTYLAKIISYFGYIGAISILLIYLITSNNYSIDNIIYALTLSVTVIVVAVPEGLPMMITLVLSSNMRKMMKNNVLVRKLVGIETSGNINCLLTDKTGTLTTGLLEVSYYINYDGNKYNNINNLNNKLYEEINNNLYYNNNSYYDDSNKIVNGNSTDKAILKFSNKDNKYKVIDKVIFNSNNKYSLVTLDNNITYIKGAKEVLLDKCNYYLDNNGNKKLLVMKDKIKDIIDKYSDMGIRVLVLASSSTNKMDNLTYQGIILINDSIRSTTNDAIKSLSSAGINVIMVTGDSVNTSRYIAKKTGIINSDSDIVMDSLYLNKLSDEEIIKLYPRIKVVARAYPKDKSRLVNILENNNLVVGMTGDGINDAPALKKANVGFAMGSGTDVAKSSADIIILDDNILSICKAVLYGRTIYKSIRKFIVFQLTVNLSALIISILGPLLNITNPVTVMQMLWINMIMDTLAGIAFSKEAPLDIYMNEAPKDKNSKIINSYMYKEIIFMSLYTSFICIAFLKIPVLNILIRNNDKYLMTSFFAIFIFMGIFNAINSRTERINIFANIFKNITFIIIFGIIFIVQIIIIYYGGNLFRTYGLNIYELLYVLGISFSVIPINQLRKIINKKRLLDNY